MYRQDAQIHPMILIIHLRDGAREAEKKYRFCESSSIRRENQPGGVLRDQINTHQVFLESFHGLNCRLQSFGTVVVET